MFFLDYKGLDNFGLHYQGSHFIDASRNCSTSSGRFRGGGGEGGMCPPPLEKRFTLKYVQKHANLLSHNLFGAPNSPCTFPLYPVHPQNNFSRSLRSLVWVIHVHLYWKELH